MQLTIAFAEGCTGDDDEQVTITAPRFIWAGFRIWIMAAGIAPVATGRREIQDLVSLKAWEEAGENCLRMTMTRTAAQWVMVYFEIVTDERIILRPDEHHVDPINELVIDGRKLG